MAEIIKLESQADIDRFAMAVLCVEYDKLFYIPEFKSRIDTAVQNAVSILNLLDKSIFNDSINLLTNAKFYE